jgi:cobalt-zinc-cadmium efflux system outer membrane protein
MRVFLLLIVLSLSLPAQERLRPLLQEALRNNPEVQAAQKKYEAARQRPQQATALPETMVSLGYSSTGNPRPFAGIGVDPVANAGIMVTQELPYPGKRGLRGAVADREAQAEFEQYQATQLSVLARMKSAWQRLTTANTTLSILERNRDLLREMLRVTEARYATGGTAQAELFRAQTQISALELRMERTRQETHARQAELNSLTGRPMQTPLGRPEPLASPDLTATPDDLLQAARQNAPMLRRNRKMIERGELAVNLARKDFLPDYALSGGYYNMGSMSDMYQVRVDLKLPLFSRGRIRAGIAEQVATLAASRHEYEAAEQTTAYRIQEDLLMAQTSRKLLRMYQDTVIPQARLTFESSLPSYQTGRLEFATLLSSVMAVLEYEMSYQEELQSYHLALIRLEEMTGVELLEAGK